MVKMVEVTEAGGALFGKETDEKISINADNINIIEDTNAEDVGISTIKFNSGKTINVTESKEELEKIINT